jgi:hypothetical protein
MVQAVILSSFAVACTTLFLLLVPRPWWPRGSTDRRDGFGGTREMRSTPLPDLPPAGGARTVPPAVAVPAPTLASVPPAPVPPASVPLASVPPASEMAAEVPVVTAPAATAIQAGARNNGFARFARPYPGRHTAAGRAANAATVRP